MINISLFCFCIIPISSVCCFNKSPLKRGKRGRQFSWEIHKKEYDCFTPIKWWFIFFVNTATRDYTWSIIPVSTPPPAFVPGLRLNFTYCPTLNEQEFFFASLAAELHVDRSQIVIAKTFICQGSVNVIELVILDGDKRPSADFADQAVTIINTYMVTSIYPRDRPVAVITTVPRPTPPPTRTAAANSTQTATPTPTATNKSYSTRIGFTAVGSAALVLVVAMM